MSPGPALALAAAVAVGAAAGLGAFTFVYAEGASYLTDEPAACANCHVMREQYDGWTRSSHRAAAVCNDCHTPGGVLRKYAAKALNGYHHSLAFTTGKFPEPIRITPRNRAVTEGACRRCHGPIVDQIDVHAGGAAAGDTMSCIRCHASVGHLR